MTEKEDILAAITDGNAEILGRLDGRIRADLVRRIEPGDISQHKVLQLVRAAALTVAPNAREAQRAGFGFATLDARGSRNLAKAKNSLSNI